MRLEGLDHVFDLVRCHGTQYSQNVTQVELIVAAIVLLVLLACASILDQKDSEDKEGLAIFTKKMFDDAEDLERHESEDASDDD